ncbi:hypothetical protein, conserved [Eimeria acervulina]|uniref:Uncharacterized protein n=1 Tax=Eimeria acervulina TaxID=5801 RepID=U6GF77_EIMAC|nr:hypothetical protein, conserved [Eimeria acervulina]CDI77993.1 hypothetical protein, conserved [Eimeria acervulina]
MAEACEPFDSSPVAAAEVYVHRSNAASPSTATAAAATAAAAAAAAEDMDGEWFEVSGEERESETAASPSAEAAAEAAGAAGAASGAADTPQQASYLADEAAIHELIKNLRSLRDAHASVGQYAAAQRIEGRIKDLDIYFAAVVQQRLKSKHLLFNAALERSRFKEIRRLATALVRSTQLAS